MINLPTDIYSVASVRNIDRTAIKEGGISGYALMTRAAEAAVEQAFLVFPKAKRWQVFCGSGNNGGDGYVVARLAAAKGIAVSAIALSAPEELHGDAETAYLDFTAQGGVMAEYDGTIDSDAELLVDGMLGSGLERVLEGRYAEAVALLNRHTAPVLALDLPSGLHGDSGRVLGAAVKADLTVTFVGLKCGLFLDRGPELVGRLAYSDLGIPDEFRAGESAMLRRIDDEIVRRSLPPRSRNAHKGDFGHVLIVGGGPGMSGAVRLCGKAALRAGAGLVTIATHPQHHSLVNVGCSELMCHPVDTPADLQPLVNRASVIAVGPGLGTGEWSTALFDYIVKTNLPLVIDADALNILAKGPQQHDDWILTPHPGEAARLLETTTKDVQSDRLSTVHSLQKKYRGTIVLKGSGSLVSAKGAQPWLCTAGNPGMASPGMGDALTGIIAALRAQNLSQEMAAMTGVLVHANAGDIAARRGERGLMASDLIAGVRRSVNP